MFKWPRTPAANADRHALADYAELVCWRDGNTSMAALSKDLGLLAENDYFDGVPEEDPSAEVVREAYSEIECRREACGGGYPFVISDAGYTLSMDRDTDCPRHIVYQYLLLATRLNMKDDRMHAAIDGTLLLEDLSADVAREYFGTCAEKLVFGTAATGRTFREKLVELCNKLGEGGGPSGQVASSTHVKDGGLDVVVWKPFSDERQGKLIGFGQCKTGIVQEDELPRLQPDAFCSNWMTKRPAFLPLRMFFVAEALSFNPHEWYRNASYAGLLFDRCRLVEFSHCVNGDVMAKVKAWTAEAARKHALPV